jgi:hypothetical protein
LFIRADMARRQSWANLEPGGTRNGFAGLVG